MNAELVHVALWLLVFGISDVAVALVAYVVADRLPLRLREFVLGNLVYALAFAALLGLSAMIVVLFSVLTT